MPLGCGVAPRTPVNWSLGPCSVRSPQPSNSSLNVVLNATDAKSIMFGIAWYDQVVPSKDTLFSKVVAYSSEAAWQRPKVRKLMVSSFILSFVSTTVGSGIVLYNRGFVGSCDKRQMRNYLEGKQGVYSTAALKHPVSTLFY